MLVSLDLPIIGQPVYQNELTLQSTLSDSYEVHSNKVIFKSVVTPTYTIFYTKRKYRLHQTLNPKKKEREGSLFTINTNLPTLKHILKEI